MAIQSLERLKKWFSRGQYPTQEQFADMMDSFVHKTEDKLPIARIEGLAAQLNGKYPAESGTALAQRFTVLEVSQQTDHDSIEDLGVKVSDLKCGVSDVAILPFDGFDRPDDPPVLLHDEGTFMAVSAGYFKEYHHTTGNVTEMMKPSETHNRLSGNEAEGWQWRPREDCLYRCDNQLYRWNGTKLVRLIDEDDVAEMPRSWTAEADEDERGYYVESGTLYENLGQQKVGDKVILHLASEGALYHLIITGWDPATGIFTSLVVDLGFKGAIVVQFDGDGIINITKVADADRLKALEERIAVLERR